MLTFSIKCFSCRFRNILVLQTFDNQSNLDLYIRESAVIDESTGEKNFIVFAGPGPMIIIDRIAYFQLFAIDPRVSYSIPSFTVIFYVIFVALCIGGSKVPTEQYMP